MSESTTPNYLESCSLLQKWKQGVLYILKIVRENLEVFKKDILSLRCCFNIAENALYWFISYTDLRLESFSLLSLWLCAYFPLMRSPPLPHDLFRHLIFMMLKLFSHRRRSIQQVLIILSKEMLRGFILSKNRFEVLKWSFYIWMQWI